MIFIKTFHKLPDTVRWCEVLTRNFVSRCRWFSLDIQEIVLLCTSHVGNFCFQWFFAESSLKWTVLSDGDRSGIWSVSIFPCSSIFHRISNPDPDFTKREIFFCLLESNNYLCFSFHRQFPTSASSSEMKVDLRSSTYNFILKLMTILLNFSVEGFSLSKRNV